jgi:hypothetical protein
MRKKLLAMLLCGVMVVSLASCGESAEESNSPSQNEPQQTISNEPTQSDDQEPENHTPEGDITFSELVVVDNDECSVKITGVDPDDIWGYTLKAELENKSADKNYMFSVQSASVDGLQSDPFFATEVAAGKKSVNDISFTDSDLEENNISFTDIELTIRVYDSDDWAADAVATETVHIYPYGQESAKVFERTAQDSDNVILDNEYVTVTVIGYDEDSVWGYTADLFLQNKSDKEIMFTVEDSSVNGYMSDPFWAVSVLPGKCAFSSMSWSDSALEEIGVDDASGIEEIEFLLRVYDGNDWTADDFASETITLNP